MRIHVSFIDRVGITQEVLALLGGRNLNLDAVEMVPPNVYIDAPTLSAEVLEELRDALFSVHGVQAVTVVDILPGQRRHLQLDALLAAMTDPVLALDSAGKILLANPALIALYGREPAGESISELFNDPALLDTLLEHGFRLPLREISVNGQTLLLDATPITDAGALLTLYQPNRIGEQLSALHHDHAEGFDALLGESPVIRTLKARAQRVAALAGEDIDHGDRLYAVHAEQRITQLFENLGAEGWCVDIDVGRHHLYRIQIEIAPTEQGQDFLGDADAVDEADVDTHGAIGNSGEQRRQVCLGAGRR